MNNPTPVTATTLGGSPALGRTKNSTAATKLLSRVASAAGPIPPSHAEMNTAGKKVMNGN